SDPARLRIGITSGDIRSHPVGYFLEGVLGQLDRCKLELIGYPTNPRSDSLTERVRQHLSAWHPLDGLSDEAAARQIHGNGIHILVELSGHTPHNRLPMLAWRPAPIQVSWLGY
ncbi:MAG: glycosyltransferase, partial [Burkholderiales bacterium]